MSKAEDILFFDVIVSLMLFTFGVGVGVANLQAFQAIQTPVLAPQPGNINCNPLDFTCNATKGIAQATAYIGWAIVNLPVLLVFFAGIFILFANIVLNVTFSPQFTSNGVPFLGIFLAGLQLYPLWDAVRTVRGSSTGV